MPFGVGAAAGSREIDRFARLMPDLSPMPIKNRRGDTVGKIRSAISTMGEKENGGHEDPPRSLTSTRLSSLSVKPFEVLPSERTIQPEVRQFLLNAVCPEAVVEVLEIDEVQVLILVKA